ncbi:AMP-binding protein [Fodinibacter luteus]|uniref:AMP-binding protein n=1 Tax=Fodinibacter luteus TaxID=552064 RepID=A0ABP8JWR5_9MICO
MPAPPADLADAVPAPPADPAGAVAARPADPADAAVSTSPADPSAPAVHHRAADGSLETLTRGDLADRVHATARLLAGARRLVHVHGSQTLGSLVGYLAAHAAGHAVLLSPPGSPAAALAATWDPDVTVDAEGAVEVHREHPARALHPDLALLLSTSGSSGSPRLVRLSWDNLRSNATAIADYLAIRPTDRAVTSLPLHYCYGLSVVHSHLLVGASVVLTDLSVADDCFWRLARDTGVTTLSGVPHTFELLDRAGFAAMDLPHLRTVTQAGGRLDPDRVVQLATLGRRRGWDLFVMYGQTEATARMAYLPPDLALEHPDAVGVPVPGGRVDVVDGEIVYSGPNVMLGYATTGSDLALGRTVDRLHTGDLGRWNAAGLLEVTGRRSRVAKVLGHRVDLDHVERTLRAEGCDVRCVDGGESLVLCAAGTTDPGDRPRLADRASRRAGIPTRCVRVLAPGDLGLDSLPHLPTGKVDYATLTGLAASAPPPEEPSAASGTLRERYAALLGLAAVAPEDSFTSLGGDSLSYVEVSLHVEERLGYLPAGWHVLTVAELEALEAGAVAALPDAGDVAGARDGSAAGPVGGVRRRAWFGGRLPTRSVETSVVLRAVAILLIVGTHAHVFRLQGTAHALLVLVGWNLARFRLGEAPRAERVRGLLIAVRRIAAPALVVVAGAHLLTGQYAWSTMALLNWAFGEERLGPEWRFWFIEAAVLVLLAVTAVVATPWGDRLERRHPLGVPLGLAAVGMAWWQGWLFPPVPHMQGSALVVSWLFCLGWAAAKARGQAQRLLVTAVAVPTIGTFSGNPRRDLLTLTAALLVIWVPTLRVPRAVVPALHVLAASSLFVYVLHWQVLQAMRSTPWLGYVAGLVAGVAYWWVWTRGPGLVRASRTRRLESPDAAQAGLLRVE